MSKLVIAIAACGALAACATAQTDSAEAQERNCVSQTEEATGSRVESTKVCPPEQPADGTE